MNVSIALVVLLLAFYLYNRYRVAPELFIGKLELTDLEGKAVKLESEGKALVLSFAASWCGPCMKELRELKKVQHEVLPVAKVVVISDESLQKISHLREQGQYEFNFYKLEGGFSGIGINSIPTTYLLNSKGEVLKKEVGYMDWSDDSTRQHLLKILSKGTE